MATKAPPKGRISIKGVRRRHSEFLRDGVSNGKKASIIKCYEDKGMNATVKKYYPDLTRTQKSDKYTSGLKRRKLFSASGRGNQLKLRDVGLSTELDDEDEDLIAHWVRDLRRAAVPVSPFMPENKAKEAVEDAGLPAGSLAASDSWKKRFLFKYRLSLRRNTGIGQITPAYSEQVAREFRLKVLETIEKEGS